jgi:hypothetical protein
MAGVRGSHRIPKKIPIILLGTDTSGRVFSEETRTLVLSRHGAGILSRNKFAPDEALRMRIAYSGRETEIRLVGHLGEDPRGNVYGVAFIDPEIDFWQIEFPLPPEQHPARRANPFPRYSPCPRASPCRLSFPPPQTFLHSLHPLPPRNLLMPPLRCSMTSSPRASFHCNLLPQPRPSPYKRLPRILNRQHLHRFLLFPVAANQIAAVMFVPASPSLPAFVLTQPTKNSSSVITFPKAAFVSSAACVTKKTPPSKSPFLFLPASTQSLFPHTSGALKNSLPPASSATARRTDKHNRLL